MIHRFSGGESLRPRRGLPRGHQDHQEQKAVPPPSSDRGPAAGVDESDGHRRQVPRRQTQASLHVEESPVSGE